MACSFGGKCIPEAKLCLTLFGTDITAGLHGTSCFQDMSQTSQFHSKVPLVFRNQSHKLGL